MSDTENTAISEKNDVEVEAVKEPVKASRPKRASVAKQRRADESDEEDAYEDAGEDVEDAPAPKKKAKNTPAKKTAGKAATQTTLTAAKSTSADPLSVTLEGDDDENAPPLDSCDELRKKINVHLDVSGQNKAAFLRDIARAGWPKNPPKIQSKQLTDFQSKKGPTSGTTSKVCNGAYVYFEKLRIAKGENKSRHRNGMEKQWGAKGMERTTQRGVWCAPGERPVVNAYGGISFK